MASFSMTDRATLYPYVTGYHGWLLDTIDKPVRVTGSRPQELVEIFEDLDQLIKGLQNTDDTELDLDEKLTPILKRSIIHTRRSKALELEERSSFTFNRGIRETLENELKPISEIIKEDWFKETEAAKLVRLTDFLSINFDEERLTAQLTRQEREYDEKFHLLLAEPLFLLDLSYYRAICELRALPVSVAYIDIDKFKDVNTEYGEPKVDRDILPQFMSALAVCRRERFWRKNAPLWPVFQPETGHSAPL